MSPTKPDETRDGVPLTNLDQPLFDGAEATKRDLVDYLDGVRGRILPALEDRPLSVIRVHRGQEAFMQKNVPKYTPDWVPTVSFRADTSKRDVAYALCNDRRTLLWFANQRAVEYHPALVQTARTDRMTHLILDLDPPEGDGFANAVAAARLVRDVLTDLGLEGAVKTSGAKGVHVFVPIDDALTIEEAAAATRAIAVRAAALDPEIATTEFVKEERGGKVFVDSTRVGGGTVIAAYSPRVRPGVTVQPNTGWRHALAHFDDARTAAAYPRLAATWRDLTPGALQATCRSYLRSTAAAVAARPAMAEPHRSRALVVAGARGSKAIGLAAGAHWGEGRSAIRLD